MTAEEYKERRDKVLNRPKAAPRYTQEEYDRYRLLCDSRIAKSIDDLPEKLRESLWIVIQYMSQQYPNTEEIYLRGSWTRGEGVTKETDPEFRRLRELIRHKTKVSDIDLVISNVRDMFELNGIKFDIIPHDTRAIKIWSKNL